ncbi:MAG: hypothetical protein PCFJNLEI_03257 [Verrucomicrobiae bacterium]|nr:hypothetical protein [Verrucomicrobiae bacterium]
MKRRCVNLVAEVGYALETATNGLAGGWVPVTNGVAPGATLTLTGTVHNTQQQFWRVRGPL